MKYRSNKRDVDGMALIFIGLIVVYIVSTVLATIGATQAERNRHLEKMEQIKTCSEEKE